MQRDPLLVHKIEFQFLVFKSIIIQFDIVKRNNLRAITRIMVVQVQTVISVTSLIDDSGVIVDFRAIEHLAVGIVQ